MPTLRELQRAFARAVDGDPAGAIPLVRGGTRDAAARLGVYANNVRATFRAALEASYPAVRRLGGETWFAGAALAYRRASPSRAGDLQPAGAGFPAFLARELDGTGHEYLADVAALEWACECAAGAADAAPLDLAALGRVPAEAHGSLVFTLHPSCRLVASRWPVVDLWSANSATGADGDASEAPAGSRAADGTIDLDAGAQRALVHRAGLEVRVRRLDAPAHAFLDAIARERTLVEAVECAGSASPGAGDTAFDLAATLTALARDGVLAAFRVAEMPRA